MSLHVDIEYANSLRLFVRNFRVKSNNPYILNFSCPICGDSSKNKTKARAYIYTKKGNLNFHCHNCGESMRFNNFLQRINPSLHQEYVYSSYKNRDTEHVFKSHSGNKPKFEEKSILDQVFDKCSSLDEDHIAVKYLESRMIPKDRYKDLYFINNIADISKLSPKYVEKMKGKEPRIVFPYYNRRGQIVGLGARDITNQSGLRYIRIKINEMHDLVFNLDKIDLKKTVYVTEGEFDSLFLPNAVAAGNSSLHLIRRVIQYDADVVLVYDNQPRNKEIVNLFQKGMNEFPVVVWPQNMVDGKDINDMIKSGLSLDDLLKIIEENTYSGLTAKLKFQEWKRV